MATSKQNADFMTALLPQYALDEAINWIAKNLNPEDVFSEQDLKMWARDNYEEEEA